jgi:UDP-N-acetylglucosamine 2-epimerase (non-hydrolysing)
MPEEINRIVADHLAEFLFLHSPEAEDNLRVEGVPEDRWRFVGNTMIDTLVALSDRFRAREAARELGAEPGSYVLVTLHRPALVDGPLLAEAIAALDRVAERMPVIFPVHPRTRKMLGERGAGGLTLIDPIGYLDFLSLEADARAVLTDSGGIQEETTYLGVPCFTLRENTERPVTVRAGTNTVLGLRPERIAEIPELLERAPRAAAQPPEKWDGTAAERLADVLEDW